MGLRESNAVVRGQILMMDPLPSISQAYAYIKQDEKTRQGTHNFLTDTNMIANSLVVDSDVGAMAVNSNSGKPGFIRGNNVGNKVPLKCTFCNFNGHTIENCCRLILKGETTNYFRIFT